MSSNLRGVLLARRGHQGEGYSRIESKHHLILDVQRPIFEFLDRQGSNTCTGQKSRGGERAPDLSQDFRHQA